MRVKKISEESIRTGDDKSSSHRTCSEHDDYKEISDNSGESQSWQVLHGASEIRWEDQSHHVSSTFTFSNGSSSAFANSKEVTRENEAKNIAAKHLAALEALKRLQHIFPDQTYELPLNFPTFKRSELVIGSRLGNGSFSVVDEIIKISLDDDHIPEKSSSCKDRTALLLSSKQASRSFVSSRCQSEHGEMRYCVKQLQATDDPDRAWSAMVDLVAETKILAQIVHPHILKLRAVAEGNPLQPGYFLVIDRLCDRLDERIRRWEKRTTASKKGLLGFRSRTFDQDLWQEKLKHACNLASAVVFLHQNRLLHRDIKPENIGFDLYGVIKLFDFGFARLLPRKISAVDDRYQLSAMTGSVRYMAPEVFKGELYNEKCDVYSFTVLLWEILTCKRPYSKVATDYDKFVKRVFVDGNRPSLPRAWSKRLRDDLFKLGWHTDVSKRLDIRKVENILRHLNGEEVRVNRAPHELRYSSVVLPLCQEKRPLLRIPGGTGALSQDDLARILDDCSDSFSTTSGHD